MRPESRARVNASRFHRITGLRPDDIKQSKVQPNATFIIIII